MRHPLATRPPRVPNDFDFPSHLLFDPFSSFAGVALIDPDLYSDLHHLFKYEYLMQF